jgi:hypothetical protein
VTRVVSATTNWPDLTTALDFDENLRKGQQVTHLEPAFACSLTSCNDLPITLAKWSRGIRVMVESRFKRLDPRQQIDGPQAERLPC